MSTPNQRRERFSIDIEPGLRRRIEVAAALRGLSVREYVEDILTQVVGSDDSVADSDGGGTSSEYVPRMTEEQRARSLKVLEEIERRGDPRAIRPGTPTVDSLELIHAARAERTRHLSRLSGLDQE